MGSETTTSTNEVANSVGSTKLAILISMAMFVLVIDTAIMNVSIASISKDLNTTVSNIQAMIAIEALVSAAFILIGGKVADLIGRKRAYSLGLLGYGLGALSMILSDTLLPMLIFWAILGGLGASLLLPSVQSLIHGNFEGLALKKAYAMVGASTSIAIAIGPLLGGFLTTYLSWRVGFVLEVVIILIVVSGLKLVKDVPYTGSREIDPVGAVLSAVGMGGIVLSILVWQEGGDKVGLLMAIGVVGITGLAYWLNKRKKEGKPILLDPGLFSSKLFRTGISGQMLQQIALGGMASGNISDLACSAKVVCRQDRRNGHMRIARHRAIESLTKFFVRRKERFEHRFAVHFVPGSLASLDAVQKFSVNAPMRLVKHPDDHIAGAVRMIYPQRF